MIIAYTLTQHVRPTSSVRGDLLAQAIIVRTGISPDFGYATGFALGRPHLVLTAAHAVTEGKIDVGMLVKGGYRFFPAKVLKRDPDNDVALLQVAASLPSSKWSGSVPYVGESIVCVGFAFGATFDGHLVPCLTRGIVSAIRPSSKRFPSGAIQTDAIVSEGCSGGPMFDEKTGLTIGMMLGRSSYDSKTTSDIPVTFGFGLPLYRLRTFAK